MGDEMASYGPMSNILFIGIWIEVSCSTALLMQNARTVAKNIYWRFPQSDTAFDR
jgi:hypothetical protein